MSTESAWKIEIDPDEANDFINDARQYPNRYIYELAEYPDFQDIVEVVGRGKKRKDKTSKEKFLKLLAELLFVNPMELYGKFYVTEQLRKDAAITAAVLTTSNIIHILTLFPFLWISYASMGWFGPISTVLTCGLLLWAIN